MPETNAQENQDLRKRVEELEKKYNMLLQSSSIPYELDKSLSGRGFVKINKPPIYLVGADQGAWLNTGAGSDMAYPPAFWELTEGALAGFWVPLYIPPRQVNL